MVEVRVVKDEVLVRRGELIDGRAALRAVEELDDATVGGCDDGRVARGRDVNGVVDSALAARVAEGVAKLRRLYARDRDEQTHRGERRTSVARSALRLRRRRGRRRRR